MESTPNSYSSAGQENIEKMKTLALNEDRIHSLMNR